VTTPEAHFAYLLHLADNSLVHGQRLAEWCGHGPVLEEDIALANIALDHIGQARLLYAHAAAIEGAGRTEDDLAYWRDTAQFRNFVMLELPHGGVASAGAADPDYAFTISRNLLFGIYQNLLWERLSSSGDAQLAAIAEKSLKEARYHLRHARDWTVLLGDGTHESHGRMRHALDSLWPYANEWFVADDAERLMAGAGIAADSATLRDPWRAQVLDALTEASLPMPADSAMLPNGRGGVHSEHMDYLLAEMQSLARRHPGATW
jgi:ring-1,2-phenylacetyl-CoA epoxidase subunit PaaC